MSQTGLQVSEPHIYLGLTNIDLGSRRVDVSRGIVIESTYAHLMSPLVMAFAKPTNGGPHPGPWKAITGGTAHDITAQISIPHSAAEQPSDCLWIGLVIVSLLRLHCDPAVTMVVSSSVPFDQIKEAHGPVPVLPFEIQERTFPLMNADMETASETVGWVSRNFETALKLRDTSQEFNVACAALDSVQFIPNTGLALISIWGALEALFSPSKGELKFRVSSLIAAYLHDPGVERLDAQKTIAKLYDKRSAAAHGKPRHMPDDLVASLLVRKRQAETVQRV